MTREEAARVLESMRVDYTFNKSISAIDLAITALRGPQPDPDTGLMPCGCGGVVEQEDFHDGFFLHSKLECLECGIGIMRAGNIIAEAHDEVKMAWNTAMGRARE